MGATKVTSLQVSCLARIGEGGGRRTGAHRVHGMRVWDPTAACVSIFSTAVHLRALAQLGNDDFGTKSVKVYEVRWLSSIVAGCSFDGDLVPTRSTRRVCTSGWFRASQASTMAAPQWFQVSSACGGLLECGCYWWPSIRRAGNVVGAQVGWTQFCRKADRCSTNRCCTLAQLS